MTHRIVQNSDRSQWDGKIAINSYSCNVRFNHLLSENTVNSNDNTFDTIDRQLSSISWNGTDTLPYLRMLMRIGDLVYPYLNTQSAKMYFVCEIKYKLIILPQCNPEHIMNTQSWLHLKVIIKGMIDSDYSWNTFESKLENLRQEPDETMYGYTQRTKALFEEYLSIWGEISYEIIVKTTRDVARQFIKNIANKKVRDAMLIYGLDHKITAILERALEQEMLHGTTKPETQLQCDFCLSVDHTRRNCLSRARMAKEIRSVPNDAIFHRTKYDSVGYSTNKHAGFSHHQTNCQPQYQRDQYTAGHYSYGLLQSGQTNPREHIHSQNHRVPALTYCTGNLGTSTGNFENNHRDQKQKYESLNSERDQQTVQQHEVQQFTEQPYDTAKSQIKLVESNFVPNSSLIVNHNEEPSIHHIPHSSVGLHLLNDSHEGPRLPKIPEPFKQKSTCAVDISSTQILNSHDNFKIYDLTDLFSESVENDNIASEPKSTPTCIPFTSSKRENFTIEQLDGQNHQNIAPNTIPEAQTVTFNKMAGPPMAIPREVHFNTFKKSIREELSKTIILIFCKLIFIVLVNQMRSKYCYETVPNHSLATKLLPNWKTRKRKLETFIFSDSDHDALITNDSATHLQTMEFMHIYLTTLI